MRKLFISQLIVLITLLIIGCSSDPEEHKYLPGGSESGVKINVMLEGGGNATLVCPLFQGKPRGSHGRECYLRSYEVK